MCGWNDTFLLATPLSHTFSPLNPYAACRTLQQGLGVCVLNCCRADMDGYISTELSGIHFQVQCLRLLE